MSGDRRSQGMSLEEFLDEYHAMDGVEKVPLFGIVFGESIPQDVEEVAKSTGGQAFDAGKQALSRIFLEIRDMQGRGE